MNGAVQIAVRRRPLTANEASDREIAAEIDQLNDSVLFVDDKREFIFDKIIEPHVTQADIYDELIGPMVVKLLNGFYCTVLAYGQTGTGKTYTMGLHSEEIDAENAGVIPRALADILKVCNRETATAFAPNISISFIEIYNEKVFDLLGTNVPINTKGQKFSGAIKRDVHSLADAQQVLVDGNKKRHVRPTKMNLNSSRSHAVFTINVEMHTAGMVKQSAMHLVDLAGSEGVRRTNHAGAALTEGVHINQGLLCIAKVIHALSDGSKVIPYRDSVLSSVLQDSLNANSFLTLLACISPLQQDLSETMSTLRFAQRTKKIKSTPQISALIAQHRKSKTPVKVSAFKMPYPRTPLPKINLNQRRLPFGCVTSTAIKMPQIPRRSDPCTPKRSNSCLNIHWNGPTDESNYHNRINSYDDLSQIMRKTNQTQGSGSLEMTMESPIAQPTRPLSALQDIQRFDNPQPSASISPIIRRVMSEFDLTFGRKHTALDAKMEPMLHKTSTFQLHQTTMQDVANAVRVNSRPLFERTISLPANMGETMIAPIEREAGNALKQTQTTQPIGHKPAVQQNDSTHVKLTKEKTFLVGGIQIGNVAADESISVERKQQNEISCNSMSASRERPTISPVNESNTIPPSRPAQTTQNIAILDAMKIAKQANAMAEAKLAYRTNVLNILNTGNVKQLQILPQIGPKKAYSIFTYRTLNGPFKDIESLSKTKFWSETAFQRFLEVNQL